MWSLEVLCHAPDRARALTEALRVLRPGGALVFSDIMAAENTPTAALQPAIDRLGVRDLATVSFYREQLSALGFTHVEFEDRSADIVTHYTRLEEEVRERAAELRGVISPGYLEGLLTNLPLWRNLARRGLLRWGLFHARTAEERPTH